MQLAASSSLRAYLSIIAALAIVAIGLAIPCPAISGAEHVLGHIVLF